MAAWSSLAIEKLMWMVPLIISCGYSGYSRHGPRVPRRTSQGVALLMVEPAVLGSVAVSGVLDELERLSALLEKGLITRERFDRQREELVSGGDGTTAPPQEDEEAALELIRGQGLQELAAIESEQGNLEEALRWNLEALDIFRRYGDRTREGDALGNLGDVYREQGKLARAVAFYTEALAIHREVGDRRGEGMALANLGSAFYVQGQYERTREFYTEALAIHREVGDKRSEGSILLNFGAVLFCEGQLERAVEIFTKALAIHREVGDRRLEGIALGNIGDALFQLQRLDEAEVAFRQAIPISDGLFPIVASAFRGSLALLVARRGRLDEAQALLQAGEPLLPSCPDEHAKFLCKKGQVQLLAGQAEGARASLMQVQDIAAESKVSEGSEVSQAMGELSRLLAEAAV